MTRKPAYVIERSISCLGSPYYTEYICCSVQRTPCWAIGSDTTRMVVVDYCDSAVLLFRSEAMVAEFLFKAQDWLPLRPIGDGIYGVHDAWVGQIPEKFPKDIRQGAVVEAFPGPGLVQLGFFNLKDGWDAPRQQVTVSFGTGIGLVDLAAQGDFQPEGEGDDCEWEGEHDE